MGVTAAPSRRLQDRWMARGSFERYTYLMTEAPLSGRRSEVGIRELRDHLSSWLEEVADGREITVTDRGKPVARIIPVNGRSRLDQLIADGLVSPATRPAEPARSRPPIPVKGSVSDLVIEQRRR
jgi:prevent-host-death family protein